MQTVARSNFTTVTTEGAILPADLLQRVVEGRDIETKRGGEEVTRMLAEDMRVVGFTGTAGNPTWLSDEQAERLLQAEPDANVNPQQASNFLSRVVDGLDALQADLNELAEERAQEVLEAHRRVRVAGRVTGVSHDVRPQLPVDVLGMYALLPT